MKLRKLTEEEYNSFTKQDKRAVLWAQYDTLIHGFEPNTWYEISLGEGESKAKTRRQLNLAAKRANVAIEYNDTKAPVINLRVNTGEPVPPPEIPITSTDDVT